MKIPKQMVLGIALFLLLSGCTQQQPPGNGSEPENGGASPEKFCSNATGYKTSELELDSGEKLIQLDQNSSELLWNRLAENPAAVSELSDLSCLEILSLSYTGVNDLTALSGLTKLKSLYLKGTAIGDLRGISGFTSLKQLYLSDTNVSDISIAKNFKELEVLDLWGTNVSDVSSLRGLDKLKEVYLPETNVSQRDCESLKEQLPETKIICPEDI